MHHGKHLDFKKEKINKCVRVYRFLMAFMVFAFLMADNSVVAAAANLSDYKTYSVNPMYYYESLNGETDRDKIVKNRNNYLRKLLNDKWASKFYGFYDTDYQRYPAYALTAAKKKEIDKSCNEMDAIVKKITAGISDDMEKYKAIHTWVTQNIYYGYSENESLHLTADEAFAYKRTTCWGYAAVESYMLKSCGIPNVIVYGFACTDNWYERDGFEDKAAHSWIMAYVNGAWHNSDPTFDSGNIFKDGKFIKKDIPMKWFDFSDEVADKTHAMRAINRNDLDIRNKTGFFKENGKLYYYYMGKKVKSTYFLDKGGRELSVGLWRDSVFGQQVFYYMEKDGSIHLPDETVKFKEKKVKTALIKGGYDKNKDKKISIWELNGADNNMRRSGLTTLKISNVKMKDYSWLKMAKWNTAYVSITNCNIKKADKIYECLKEYPYLYDLDLRGNSMKNYQMYKKLFQLKNLQRLDLRQNGIKSRKKKGKPKELIIVW